MAVTCDTRRKSSSRVWAGHYALGENKTKALGEFSNTIYFSKKENHKTLFKK
jgi:hypothetical protein